MQSNVLGSGLPDSVGFPPPHCHLTTSVTGQAVAVGRDSSEWAGDTLARSCVGADRMRGEWRRRFTEVGKAQRGQVQRAKLRNTAAEGDKGKKALSCHLGQTLL